MPLKNPQKGMIIISKKTVKHTLRMSEQESQKLDRLTERAGISKAEGLQQRASTHAHPRLLESYGRTLRTP